MASKSKTTKKTVVGTKIDLKGNNASYGVKNKDGTITYTVKDSNTGVGSVVGKNALGGIDKMSNSEISGTRSQGSTGTGETYKEVPIISSEMGKDYVRQADSTIANLSPITAQPETPVSQQGSATTPGVTQQTPTPTTPEPQSNDFLTYINESTGQEQTLRGTAISDQNKKNLESQGYTLATSDTSKVQEPPEIQQAQKEYDDATASVDSFMSRLESSLISDKELASDIRQIKSGYNARMDEMRQINERRKIAMNTLGTRLGARYTGGTAGIFGSILSEEERQGLDRIEKYENDKQDAILAAKKAAKEQNFAVYTQLAAKAEKIQENKAKELKDLKTAQAEQTKKLAEEKQQAEYDALIAEQLGAGVTDPLTLLQNLGGKVPYDQIKEITELLPKPKEDFTLSEGQARYDADGNLIASKAKTYAPKVLTPGLSSGQVSAFNSIVGKYNASPLIAASDRTIVLKNSIEQARNNPDDGATQLNLVYSYIQALDTYQSAVREGELALVNSIDSKVGKLENWVSQIQNGQVVRPEVVKQIADAAENLVNTIDEGAARKEKSFESQATTVGLGTQWKQYISGFTQSYNANGEPEVVEKSNADFLDSGVWSSDEVAETLQDNDAFFSNY